MKKTYKYLITGINTIDYVFVMSLCKDEQEVAKKVNKFNSLPHTKELRVTKWNFN